MDIAGLVILLAIGLAVYWALLVGHTAWMLTHPPRRTYAWAVARSLPGSPDELPSPARFQSWTFRSRGMDLPVWDLQGGDAGGPWIVVTHGWGDSRVTMLSSGRINGLLPLCSRLLLWDMAGHGDSPARSRCTLGEREPEDLRALISVLNGADGRTGDPAAAARLVLYGFSLGAVVSLRAASQSRRVDHVIAEAPYSAPWVPARNVLRLRGLPHRANLPAALALTGLLLGKGLAWWPRPGREPRGWLAFDHIQQPVLVLHGEADEISPVSEGQSIAARLPRASLHRIPGCGHHDMWIGAPSRVTCAAAVSDSLAALRPATVG